MAATSTYRMRSTQRQTRLFLLLSLLASAALAADVEQVIKEEGTGGKGPAAVEEAGVDSTAGSEIKEKRQAAVYSGPYTSLLSQAYQLPTTTSGESAATLVSSGTQKALAYQPLAGLGLPLGYGSVSSAYSPSLLTSGAYPGLLSAASSSLSNYSSAGSPLMALLSAGYLAAPSSSQHNFTLPVAANLLAQGSSYFPSGSFYASAAPSAANFPQNFTFGQPAASGLFAQNTAAYPSLYPAPPGFRQNFNAGLFGAASTSPAFPGGVFAQGGVSPGTAGSPFTFFSYPVAAKTGQQSLATVGVSNSLLSPHQPLSLEQARRRFPQHFAGVEEPYVRFQQQLQQQQQQEQQQQQPHRQQQQQPLQASQQRGPTDPPKPAQVTEFPEEQTGSGYARPRPASATNDENDDDDDGSYEERPSYKSHRYHGGAGVDHHKIRAEQESDDEDGSERHPNSYQKIIYHNKPYHGEEESGKSSYPGYYPKAAYHKKHYAGNSEDEDSRRPQDSSSEDEEDDEDHRPAYSSSYQSHKSQTPASRYHPDGEAEELAGGRPRPKVTSAYLRSYSRPYYPRPETTLISEDGNEWTPMSEAIRSRPGQGDREEAVAGSDRYTSLRFPAAELDSHFNRVAAASLSSNPGGPRPAAQTLHTYRFKVPDYATETYSPVTGRPTGRKSAPQRQPYQGHAEDDDDTQQEDSEGRYSSPTLRIHKTAWSYTHSSTR